MSAPSPRHVVRVVWPACLLLLAALAAGFLTLGSAKRSDAAAIEKNRIVLIAGEPSHPSGQHEFNAGAILLARALNAQSGLPVQVDVVHNGWPEDETVFESAKAVIIYSDGNAKHPANQNPEKLDALAKSGVGLMFMHYAVEVPAGEMGERFKRWIGGQYEGGFSVNPHWTTEFTAKKDHPISSGVPNLTANDEWYYNMRFAEPKTAVDVLTGVPTREKINRYVHWTPAGEKGLGKKQAVMWAVERKDGGRGVGFTGGHWHRNWAIDDFRKLVLNGIVWTAGMEVPENGVSSEPVTEDQLNENLDPKQTMEHVALPSPADLTQPAADPVAYGWPGGPKRK